MICVCYVCTVVVLRAGPSGDDPQVQAVAFHHEAEGAAAERGGGPVGDGWSSALPLTPQPGAQTPPPALQTLRLRIHRSAMLGILVVQLHCDPNASPPPPLVFTPSLQ